MTSNFFLFVPMLLLLLSCSVFPTNQYSPKDDQYWALMVKESEEGQTSILEIIKKRSPALYTQIQNDSEDHELLNFWGQSLNFDSGAKKQIINDSIIADLHGQFGLANPTSSPAKVVHAGITHTYGYLFSVLNTPYGFKRKRWTLPTLNYAFALQGGALSPETIEGGLLSNVTYFAGTLAFKNDSNRLLLKGLKNVAGEIKNFNYYSLNIEHLDEELPTHTLRTTLLRLPFKQELEENDYLLIYSIMDKALNKESLITVFPITQAAYSKIIAIETLGANHPIVIRYNAYLEGLMGQKLNGMRKLSKESR